MDYKKIHMGSHIKKISEIRELSISRACLFLKCSHKDILEMHTQKSIDCDTLLRWCKLLDYNFFMFYHTHLQLYKPMAASTKLESVKRTDEAKPYIFRKNLYSSDIVNWLLERIEKEELSVNEIMTKYNIPRTTIYRWIKRRKTKTK